MEPSLFLEKIFAEAEQFMKYLDERVVVYKKIGEDPFGNFRLKRYTDSFREEDFISCLHDLKKEKNHYFLFPAGDMDPREIPLYLTLDPTKWLQLAE